jgi:hypothetical protein
MRSTIIFCTATALSACGLGDTATTAALNAKNQARQIEQARETQRQAVADIEKANEQATQRNREAEAR